MATEQQLRVLTAKKENLFRRIQAIYDASNNISTSENLRIFKIKYEGFEQTSLLFTETIASINLLELKLDKNFVPDYQSLTVSRT